MAAWPQVLRESQPHPPAVPSSLPLSQEAALPRLPTHPGPVWAAGLRARISQTCGGRALGLHPRTAGVACCASHSLRIPALAMPG